MDVCWTLSILMATLMLPKIQSFMVIVICTGILLIIGIIFLISVCVVYYKHNKIKVDAVQCTHRQMVEFEYAISWYIKEKQQSPGSSLPEALKELHSFGKDKTRSPSGRILIDGIPTFDFRSFEMVLQNKDAWGEPFVYEVKNGKIYIKSKGPNRKNDDETGDDIICIIDLGNNK